MRIDGREISENVVLALVAAVQFVNILDFVMVMPLGPDFAKALAIPESHIGWIAAAYTGPAAVSGLLSSIVVDRFDRRTVLGVSILGLVLGTLAGGFAFDLYSMLTARAIAGVFGGPATSIAYAIVSDLFPPEKRGRAIGFMMGAFSVASIFGIPAALRLATFATWRAPFFGLAALGLVVNVGVFLLLPRLRLHLERTSEPIRWSHLFGRPVVLVSWLATAVVFGSSFLVIPNISAFVQHNLEYPREYLDRLYLVGGIANLIAMQAVGRLVDRFGSAPVGTFGAISLSCVIAAGFVVYPPALPVMAVFVGFMVSMAFRNVAFSTLTTKVPAPAERGRFTSIQSAIQNLAGAGAASIASVLLTTTPNGALDGLPTVASLAICLTLVLPFLLWWIERTLRRTHSEN